ncbi:hypothetical protein TorRG33x02_177470 [Trema orientale]|uniref:Uncharacterized protein n=1 Tax=Trema orientale TaxID=63057 RepID=A0A2P5ELH1_TREOI|nr:hypothetical protein TorRG33x02_177470 [Trema orientale]
MQEFAMGDPTINYIVDAIRQMDVEYRDLKEQKSGLEHQLKLMLEENKQREEDRRRFQNVVFDLLFWSKTPSHVGSEGGVFGNEKLSSGDVKLDNSKGIDIDRDLVLLETKKSILKSRLLTRGPLIFILAAEVNCLYIGRSGTRLVESRIRRCTRNASLDISLTSKTCEKKKGRSKSSESYSKMSGCNGQVMKYRVGSFKVTKKLNAPRDGEVLEYIFDESLLMR